MHNKKTYLFTKIISLILIVGLYYFYKSLYGFSDVEVSIWNSSYLLNSGISLYDYLLNYSPLIMNNTLNIYRSFFFDVSIMTPFFTGVFVFYSFLFFEDSFSLTKSNKSDYQTFSILLILLTLNPFFLNLILNDFLSLIVFFALLCIFNGLRRYNVTFSPRSIFLCASGLAALVLSGELGVLYALVISVLLPFLTRGELFKKNTLSGYLLFAFPALCAVFGTLYLAWLSQKEFGQLLFVNGSILTDFSSLLVWLWFLPIVIYGEYIKKSSRLSEFLLKNFEFFTCFFTHFIAILLNKNISYPALVSVYIFISYFNMKFESKRNVIFICFYLLSVSWGLSIFNKDLQVIRDAYDKIEPTIAREHDSQLQSWLLNQSSESTIVLSSNYSKATMFMEDFTSLKTPIAVGFHKEIDYLDSKYDRIIVEKPESENYPTVFQAIQSQLFYFGMPEHFITFHNPKWKVLSKRNYLNVNSIVDRSILSKFKDLYLYNLLYLFLLFDILFIGWKFVFMNKSSKERM